MKNLCIVLALVSLLVLIGLHSGQSLADDGGDIVPINGTAYWATEPTGPDFAGVTRIPFQAQNPTLSVWDATRLQNEGYLRSDAVPLNVQVSHSGWFTYASHFINDFSEVMVCLDPTDPDHLLGASKFFFYPATYDFYTGVFESYNGGYSWTQFQPAGVEAYSMTSDPVTTFDHLGNGYFTLLTRGPVGLDMLKKPVGGSWGPPVVVDRSTYTDKQWIMGDQDPQGISPYAGYLYMSWTDVNNSRIVLSRSTDSNGSWSSPLQLASGSVQGSIPGVAPDGTVYVVYGRNIFYGPTPGTLEFLKSTNGGASFGSYSVAANITTIPWHLPDPFGHSPDFRTPASLPAFAVSPVDGSLYIAWADYRNGDSDIYFTRSTDAGTSWSAPVRLNDDPVGNGMDQFQPQVSVAPNGRVAVMWFDRRLACPDLPWIPASHVGLYNGCIDTFMTRSYDGGQTWDANLRASAQSWDWTINLPVTGGGDGFIGDYQGIASNNSFDFPFWNATAELGENPDNYQQIFVAIVPAFNYNLTPSVKAVAPELVHPGETLSYNVVLENGGVNDVPSVHLTDTLPLSTTYQPDSLSYSSGSGAYDPATRAITWTGAVSVGLPVTLTFQVTSAASLEDGDRLVNTALINDGAGVEYQRVATATVSLPPTILATDPADSQTEVLLDASLVITFSEAMEPGTLGYTVTPDPGGWAVSWNGSQTVATLDHTDWAISSTYTMSITAQDQEGESLVPGAAPNPWSFSTQSSFMLYLPLALSDN